jgi:hypothetical protein
MFDQTPPRVFCRNQRCRSKLPEPTHSDRNAFCSKFCCTQFYRSRCVICEEPMQRTNGRQMTCRRRACRNALRRRPYLGRY